MSKYYVITLKDKEVFRSKSDKYSRSAFHKLAEKHGLIDVKVSVEEYNNLFSRDFKSE